MIREIAFFCYPVKNLAVARTFYEGILSLKPTSTWITNDTNGMIEYDVGNATLAIGAGADNFIPSPNGASAALEVDDFDATIKLLKDKNVPFALEPIDTPVCRMAVVRDPDGSAVMIHQRKKTNQSSG